MTGVRRVLSWILFASLSENKLWWQGS